MTELPVIDVSSLLDGAEQQRVADEIGAACRDVGFFYVVGHRVPTMLSDRLEQLSREFFARPLDEKQRIRMDLGGRAWGGYFTGGGAQTWGITDYKVGR